MAKNEHDLFVFYLWSVLLWSLDQQAGVICAYTKVTSCFVTTDTI